MKSKTLGVGINTEHIKTDGVDFIGKKVEGPAELASLLQTYRNPLYETCRIFYMKDKYVVAAEAISNHLPDMVNMAPDGDRNKPYAHVNKLMKALEADGYYICHNHPSGDPTPSAQDVVTTIAYSVLCEGFLGHIVLDHTKFSYISENGEIELLVVPKHLPEDIFRTATVEHPLLGTIIDGRSAVAELGRKLIDCNQTEVSLHVFINAGSKVQALEEVSSSLIEDKEAYKDYLKKRASEYGSVGCFLVTGNDEIYAGLDDLIKKNYITDTVLITEYGFYWSRGEDQGITMQPEYTRCGEKESEVELFKDIQYDSSIGEEMVKKLEETDLDLEI